MRASHAWLRGFVPHTLTPADVERLISTHVATVDSVTETRADLAPIVVARVVEAGRHPDSDHLWVTRVDDGTGEPLDVVCGAPNVTVGTLYPFARTGTVLPGGIKIERRKIRGAVSNGMLCSARELGLGEEHDGILALAVDAAPGTPFLDAMSVGDVQYEIDVLTNRPDLLSHIGLAREISALSGVPMQVPDELTAACATVAPVAPLAVVQGSGATGGAAVRVDDTDGCPRYAAFVIRGVTVGPSPAWLKERVESIGSRSISNIVDITNYFLHGYGQPMHAFDLGRLGGAAIVVRRARAGERLVTLDGVDRALTADMLVIADSDRAQAVAGVIGGRDSEVTETTTDVLLEVANFDAASVRRTRRALGISTDASHRFERGTDPAMVAEAGALAAAMIAALGGGHVDGAPVLVGSAAAPLPDVRVRPSRMSRLLGAPIGAEEIGDRLRAIGFDVRAAAAEPGSSAKTGGAADDAVVVTPPSWRRDVVRDVDVLEELARLRGFGTLPDALSPFRPSGVPDAPLYLSALRVRDTLVAAGFSELRPLPFVKGGPATHVRVTNPLADDEPYLRTALLSTLGARAEFNLARRTGDLRLFEVGSAFLPRDGSVDEVWRAAALLMGRRRPVHFTEPDPPVFDAWDAKAVAVEMVRAARPDAVVAFAAGTGDVLWSVTADGEPVGDVRALSLDAPPWASPAFGVEILLGAPGLAPVAPPGTHANVGAEPGRVRATPRQYRHLPVTPAAEFDLAFLVPDTVRAADVEATLVRTGGDLLERVVLFDEFRGTGVPAGQRSLAWRLTFRHADRTLHDKEIAGRRQKLIANVEREHGVVARTS